MIINLAVECVGRSRILRLNCEIRYANEIISKGPITFWVIGKFNSALCWKRILLIVLNSSVNKVRIRLRRHTVPTVDELQRRFRHVDQELYKHHRTRMLYIARGQFATTTNRDRSLRIIRRNVAGTSPSECGTWSTRTSSTEIGHYTQMVWATTHLVGCGVSHCTGGKGPLGKDFYMYVCNYAPRYV